MSDPAQFREDWDEQKKKSSSEPLDYWFWMSFGIFLGVLLLAMPGAIQFGVKKMLAQQMGVGSQLSETQAQAGLTDALAKADLPKILSDPDIDASLPDAIKIANASVLSLLAGSETEATKDTAVKASAVIINAQGDVITNRHNILEWLVIEEGATVKLMRSDGLLMEATVAKINPSRGGADFQTDMALLKIINPPDDLVPVKFAPQKPNIGDVIYTIGSPTDKGKETIVKSTITGFQSIGKPEDPNEDLIKLDNGAIAGGNSGGGLFNESGEFLGINSAGTQQQRKGPGFSLFASTVESFVESQGSVAGRSDEVVPVMPTINISQTSVAEGTVLLQLESGKLAAGIVTSSNGLVATTPEIAQAAIQALLPSGAAVAVQRLPGSSLGLLQLEGVTDLSVPRFNTHLDARLLPTQTPNLYLIENAQQVPLGGAIFNAAGEIVGMKWRAVSVNNTARSLAISTGTLLENLP